MRRVARLLVAGVLPALDFLGLVRVAASLNHVPRVTRVTRVSGRSLLPGGTVAAALLLVVVSHVHPPNPMAASNNPAVTPTETIAKRIPRSMDVKLVSFFL